MAVEEETTVSTEFFTLCDENSTCSTYDRSPVCWNCQRHGHLYRDCRASRNKFCFSCGFANHTKATCPKCAKHWSKND